MNNAGQCCVAAKRFIVVDKVADQFITKFQAALEALTPGDPMEASTTLGPLCSEKALLNLLDQVKRSVAAGARILMGGDRINRTGAFMQPSILTDIKKGTPAYMEEFFGPVALFFRVAYEEEAIALANDSIRFGRLGVYRRYRTRQTRGLSHCDRNSLRQSPHLDRTRITMWRR